MKNYRSTLSIILDLSLIASDTELGQGRAFGFQAHPSRHHCRWRDGGAC